MKVELVSEAGEEVIVDLPHEKFHELAIHKDDFVFVSMKDSRVFVEDYSI